MKKSKREQVFEVEVKKNEGGKMGKAESGSEVELNWRELRTS